MADIKFDIPERFNMSVAETGVMFEVRNTYDDYYGSFQCRLVDQDSPAYKLKQERISKELARNNRNKKVDDETLVVELFINAVLVDWKDVKAGGKDVPFSKDNARAYFSQQGTKFVLGYLMEEAQDVRNYGEQAKEDVAGN